MEVTALNDSLFVVRMSDENAEALKAYLKLRRQKADMFLTRALRRGVLLLLRQEEEETT